MGRVKRNDLLFYTAWGLFLISILVGYTIWSEQEYGDLLLKGTKLVRYLAYAICCLKIMLERYQTDTFSRCSILVGIFLISSFGSGNKTMVLYLLLLFAAIHVDAIKTIQMTNKIQIGFLCIIVLLSLTGHVTDYIFGDSDRIRHGLGFAWATTAPILYFYIMLGYIYLKREKISLPHYLLLEGINIWFYKMTNTRMAFVLSSAFLLFFAIESLFKHPWKHWKKIKRFWYILPAAICIFAFAVHWKYDGQNEVWNNLNKLTSGRLYLGQNAISTYGIPVFGQKMEWVGFSFKTPTVLTTPGYNYVDCSYLQLALEYGLLFLVMVVAIYSIAVYRAVKIRDYYLTCILLIILAFCVTEPRLMNFAFNPFPIFAFGRVPEHV